MALLNLRQLLHRTAELVEYGGRLGFQANFNKHQQIRLERSGVKNGLVAADNARTLQALHPL